MWGTARKRAGWAAVTALGLVLLAACTSNLPDRQTADGRRVDGAMVLAPTGPEQADARFDLPTGAWQTARVTLQSTTFREQAARVTCDAPVVVNGPEGRKWVRPGGHQRVTVPAKGQVPARLELTSGVTTCRVTWADHAITLTRPEVVAPSVAAVDRARGACVSPPPGTLDPLAQAFYAHTALSRTCALRPGPVEIVETPIDALAARLQALTGATLRCAHLAEGNPDIRLDFSNAPKLDLIVLASLHVRADYCGALMQQAMTWHAARGTPVRILATAALQTGKDRDFWNALAARYPNVQIQYYRWQPRGIATPATEFAAFHRANHVKLLIALSSEPGRSRLIMGGRNLHDGFFFAEPFEIEDHPELRSYDDEWRDGLAWFATFEDVDLVIRDDATVRQIAAHFGKLWRRDAPGQVLRPASEPGRVGPVPTDGVMRHFISQPWADDRALEVDFVRMIDAARREVTIVTPFLYPPPAVDAALARAQARGVEVTLIARLDSTEPSAPVTRALAKDYMNRRYRDFAIYDYVPTERMIHTKILVIDGRLAMSSSVNMNARSFGQDTENGLIFLDRAMAARLGALAETYRQRARRIDAPLPLTPLERTLAAIPVIRPLF